jgi:putative MFS transporter
MFLWLPFPRESARFAENGLLISIGYAGQIVGSLFFDWWAEGVGRVPCALYTLLIFAIMNFCCALAWSVPSMMITRL